MSDRPLSEQVARGSLLSLAGQATVIVCSLVATPILIRELGPARYAILTLFNVVNLYCGFSEMGLGVASTRLASDERKASGPAGEAALVVTAASAVALSALTMLLVMSICSPSITRMLGIRGPLVPDAIFGFRAIAVAAALRSLTAIMNTSMLLQMRMGLYAVITNGVAIVQVVSLPIVAKLGYGLRGLAVVLVATSALLLSIHVVFAFRLLPNLIKGRPSFRLLTALAHFGVGIIGYNATLALVSQSEKLLLPAKTSFEALAYYAVASNLAGLVLNVPAALGQSLIPAFSLLQGHGDMEARSGLYTKVQRITLLWTPAVIMLLIATGPLIIRVWSGAGYASQSYIPFVILLIGLLVNVPTSNATFLLIASGRSRSLVRLNLLLLPMYAAMAYFLCPVLGAVGAAVTWTTRAIIDGLIQRRVARTITGPLAPAFSPAQLRALVSSHLPLAVLAACSVAGRTPPPPVLCVGAAFATAVVLLAVWHRVLLASEKSSISAVVARLVGRERAP